MRHSLVRRSLLAAGLAAAFAFGSAQAAENYKIDPNHSFVTFEISHLGFSMLQGRFNKLEGSFSYDAAQPAASKIAATVRTDTVDTNFAERDKHLREKYLDVKDFPEAKFVSTKFTDKGDGKATLDGDLTLHGVTKPVSVALEFVGAGDDPWGGYRRGYTGTTTVKRSDFGMTQPLGPKADSVALKFIIEGVREK